MLTADTEEVDVMDLMIYAAEAGGVYSFDELTKTQKKMKKNKNFEPSLKETIQSCIFQSEITVVVRLGLTSEEEVDWMTLLLPMAQDGSLGAQLLLAQIATDNIGCKSAENIERTKQALTLLVSAAEVWSHPMAYYYASRLTGFLHTATGEKSQAEAAAWLLKAARSGHARAAHEVGLQYAMGTSGFPKDIVTAAQYIRYANSLGFNPDTRAEILTHPMTLARYEAKGMAKSSDIALPDLELGYQPYATLLANSNYIKGPQYE